MHDDQPDPGEQPEAGPEIPEPITSFGGIRLPLPVHLLNKE